MHDQLAEALDMAWRLLGRGAADRRSPVHTPVVTSVDGDGSPDARVMVLRSADRGAALLRFHTDARSPKCAALDGAAVSVLAYHPGEAVQLRLAGTARILVQGAEVDRIWAASTPFARRCYLLEAAPGSPLPAPGSGLPAWVEGRKPEVAELVPARANFALVMVDVAAVDWLHLAQAGHRRARFAVGDGWQGAWVVP
ncbi:MAG: pyridoxamine 5'-phosphate oxidase family protein [Sandarakinorhabdus sp.]|nr:pyridoxamine 5'-phosphate oxidase family protein [Sandarakinorhabdus sp.]